MIRSLDLPDEHGMVALRVAARIIGEQVQYVSRYHTGIGGAPVLTAGLRVSTPDTSDYHRIRIHQDDVAEFVSRVRAHQLRARQ